VKTTLGCKRLAQVKNHTSTSSNAETKILCPEQLNLFCNNYRHSASQGKNNKALPHPGQVQFTSEDVPCCALPTVFVEFPGSD